MDPVLFVPSERVLPSSEQVGLVLQRLQGGDVVVPAYTSLDALVRACGDEHPWVGLRAGDLDALLEDAGATAVVLDTAFGPAP